MSNITQEFFWTPEELVSWLRRICSEFGLWLVVWRAGNSAELISPGAMQPSMFEAAQDDSIQVFLGKPSLCPDPRWRVVGDRRELDFARSYAVQLVPSVLSADGKTLLQGRLAILRSPDYDDRTRAVELAILFRQLRAELRRDSDGGHVVVQPLPGGERKRWRDMLVGRAVAGSGLKLKQFSRGEVEFRVESA
jgi:hypothetical protein